MEEVAEIGRVADEALHRLARLTVAQSGMTPADVALAHLAETVGALSQIAVQLGAIFDRSRDTHHITTNAQTDTDDADLVLDTARLHLDAVRPAAVEAYRHLSAAREETAQLRATPDVDRHDASGHECTTRLRAGRPAEHVDQPHGRGHPGAQPGPRPHPLSSRRATTQPRSHRT